MSTKDESISAFPVPCATPFGDGHLATGGMSLRDYFAAKALSGLMAQTLASTYPERAFECYQIADAMLEARK